MIFLSNSTEKLKSRIYDVSEEYQTICLFETLAEIFSDMSEATIDLLKERSDPIGGTPYTVEVEGKTINCNYINAHDSLHFLKGDERIETPDGTYHVDVRITVNSDVRIGGARIIKVSLDLFNDMTNLTGIGSKYFTKGNLINGLSFYVDCYEAELQGVVDSLWKKVRERPDTK